MTKHKQSKICKVNRTIEVNDQDIQKVMELFNKSYDDAKLMLLER
jgi:hypothetical protein